MLMDLARLAGCVRRGELGWPRFEMCMCDEGSVKRPFWVGITTCVILLPLGALPSAALPETTGKAVLFASADSAGHSYLGPHYPSTITPPPTRYENQSKLWFHDGAWWATMIDPERPALRVMELLPDHTWRQASDPIGSELLGTGDALADGDTVRVLFTAAEGLLYMLLGYDAASRTYGLRVAPTRVAGRGVSPSATLARDSTSRLWVSTRTETQVLVAYSDDDGMTWTKPFAPPVPGTSIPSDEASAVVAFDESIGVLWSDQQSHAFKFAVHRDGDPSDVWGVETALAGANLADDHISVKVVDEDHDSIVAVVKTSQGDLGEDPDAPLVLVLKRDPNGQWTHTIFGTVGDDHTNPIIQVDSVNRQLYVLATAPYDGNPGIAYKASPIDAPRFEPGRGTPLIFGGTLRDPTGSKQPLTAESGLVTLASDVSSFRYRHAEFALVPPGQVTQSATGKDVVPTVPESVIATPQGADSVLVSWGASFAGGQWVPEGEGPPVTEYVVLRNGVPAGKTAQRFFVDTDVAAGNSYRYSVLAVGPTGTRSPPSPEVAAAVPRPRVVSPWIVIGVVAFVAASGAGLLFTSRRRHAAIRRLPRGAAESASAHGRNDLLPRQ
jgi:hypothetical protein